MHNELHQEQEQLQLYRTWPISQAHHNSATLKKKRKSAITFQRQLGKRIKHSVLKFH
uniref:Uncharacterized protein n=1 Tax=Athene cunicularia TaxID=194338 RepID=A0A663MT85_ATHCN